MNATYAPAPARPRPETVPYEAEVNGDLNLNSYSGLAVAGLVSHAFEHLRSQSVPLGPAAVDSFARVLAGIVLRVQLRTTGSTSFQAGANTRLRGFLHLALETFPAPFTIVAGDGGTRVPATADHWDEWVALVERLLASLLTSAIDLYGTAHETMGARPQDFFAEGGAGALVASAR